MSFPRSCPSMSASALRLRCNLAPLQDLAADYDAALHVCTVARILFAHGRVRARASEHWVRACGVGVCPSTGVVRAAIVFHGRSQPSVAWFPTCDGACSAIRDVICLHVTSVCEVERPCSLGLPSEVALDSSESVLAAGYWDEGHGQRTGQKAAKRARRAPVRFGTRELCARRGEPLRSIDNKT